MIHPILQAALLTVLVAVSFSPASAYGKGIQVAQIHPHEAAYQEATLIVVAHVHRFDERGAWIRVDRCERGGVVPGTILNLRDTSRYPFLAEKGASLVAFVRQVEGDRAVLVFRPTSGGVIWEETMALAMIATAHADPKTALHANEPRTQLAAAYFLTVGKNSDGRNELDDEQREIVVDVALWGLGHQASEVAQAAAMVLESIGVEVGSFHPSNKVELRRRLADEIATSLE